TATATATATATETATATATASDTATTGPSPTHLPALIRPADSTPIALPSGPHPFIGDFLIEQSDNVQRVVNQPLRQGPGPIISGWQQTNGFRNFNFTASVIRDAATGRFRIWYVSYDPAEQQRFTAYTESADGI